MGQPQQTPNGSWKLTLKDLVYLASVAVVAGGLVVEVKSLSQRASDLEDNLRLEINKLEALERDDKAQISGLEAAVKSCVNGSDGGLRPPR
jgi:hypothetical protein